MAERQKVYIINRPNDPQQPWQLWAVGDSMADFYVASAKTRTSLVRRAEREGYELVQLS